MCISALCSLSPCLSGIVQIIGLGTKSRRMPALKSSLPVAELLWVRSGSGGLFVGILKVFCASKPLSAHSRTSMRVHAISQFSRFFIWLRYTC
jgi:hypothetical protein